jgi:hypothetical protein
MQPTGGDMFEELPLAWDSNISLRGAMFSAIGWGFNAGMAFGVFVFSIFQHATSLHIGVFLSYLVISLALVVRFYFLVLSRVREQPSSRD